MKNKSLTVVKFHKKYYLPILNGDKTQTMRTARKRLDVKVNEVVNCAFTGWNKTIRVKITKIGYKQFKSITDEDAQLEGYNTKEELIEALLEFYPNLDKWDRLYYYRFKVL